MSYKNHTVSNGGTTTGFDPAPVIPTGTLEGDCLAAVVMTSDNNPDISPTPPSGWTLQASGSMPIDGTAATSPNAIWIYLRDSGASAADETNAGSGTYTWTFSGSEEQMATMINCDPATWGQFAKNELTGTRTTIDAPTVTTTDANELVFHCAGKDGGVVFTGFPSGDATMLSELIGATSGAGAAFGIVREEYVSPGATGVKAFTHANEESQGFTFSLVPDAVGTRDQEAFRYYEDGTESGATALENQNVDLSIGKETTFGLRVGTQTVGDVPTESCTLEYKENGDAASEWRKVP